MADVDHLSALPEELIDAVCSSLLATDVRNFRLTSRVIKEKSYHAFAVHHFKTTQIMLTRESLETLIQLANDKRSGPIIRELQICLVTFPDEGKTHLNGLPLTEQEIHDFEKLSPLNKEETDSSDVTTSVDESQEEYTAKLKRKRRRLYGQYMHAQNTLRRQSTDVKLLSDAFACLPALESITILGRLDAMNLPWGVKKIRADIGAWPPSAFPAPYSQVVEGSMTAYGWLHSNSNVLRTLQRFCNHTMAVIFGALLLSGIRLKRSLKIEGAPYDFPIPPKSSSRRLFPTGTPAKTFSADRIQDLKPAFADLKELHLRTFGDYNRRHDQHSWQLSLHDWIPLSWLKAYIPLWSNVRVLSIRGARGTAWHCPAEHLIFNILASTVFPSLRKFEVGPTFFRIRDLIRILQNHSATLEVFRARDSMELKGHGSFFDLLRAMTELPTLRMVEIDAMPEQFNEVYDLSGTCGLRRIWIDKTTPPEFHAALERKIEAIMDARRSH